MEQHSHAPTGPRPNASWLPIQRSDESGSLNQVLVDRLYDQSGDGYLLVDEKGIIRGANQGLLDLLSYSRPDIDNRSLETLLPGYIQHRHGAFLRDYFADPVIRPMGNGLALFAQNHDGEAIPVDISLSPCDGPLGRLVLAKIRDRRDELRQTDKFQVSALFRLLVEGASDHAIVMLDPEGIVTTWNIGAVRNKGYQSDEIIGRNFSCFYTEEDRRLGRPQADLAAARAAGALSTEAYRVRKDGRLFWAAISLTALHDVAGRFVGFVKVTRDVSERKEAERKIKEMNVRLEERVRERTDELLHANQELESFAYAISHDLRAPLRAMSGFAQALIEDCAAALPANGLDHLQEIQKASHQMGELIEGILTLSRVTRGELVLEQVDLSALAQQIAVEFSRGAPERKVVWLIEPGLVCRGDRRMLQSVMRNLLENALKYSARRRVTEIGVLAKADAEGISFHVTDNGAGFDMRYADLLFKPFQRLHRQDEFSGIGIGLATVQRIIHRHGGEIRATAAPDGGADFSFTLGAGRTGPSP